MTRAPRDPDLTTYSGRFAARLRTLREKTGMTGVEMAAVILAAGYTASARTYYAWESGDNSPPLEAFPVLAKALNLKSPRSLLPIE